MNAKQELKKKLIGNPKIVCAIIQYGTSWNENDFKAFKLYPGHTETQANKFFDSLDFEYDNGYGGQELYGIVWLEDNTWLERYEYDGSECWDCKSYPKIEEGYNKIKFD